MKKNVTPCLIAILLLCFSLNVPAQEISPKQQLQQALQKVESLKSKSATNNKDYGWALMDAIDAYHTTGQFEKAIPLGLEFKALMQRLVGTNHPDYTFPLDRLAISYHQSGKFDLALPLLEESVKIKKKACIECPRYFDALLELAFVKNSLEQQLEALPLVQEAENLLPKVFKLQDIHLAFALEEIGFQYYLIGDYKKALSFFIQSAPLKGKLLGSRHNEYLATLQIEVMLYELTGQLEQAIPIHQKFISNFAQLLPPKQLSVSRYHVAIDYLTKEQDEQAIPILEDIIQQHRSHMPEKVYHECQQILASFYSYEERYEQALPLLEDLVIWYQTLSDSSNADFVDVIHSLAEVYENTGAMEQAVPLYEYILSTRGDLDADLDLIYSLSLESLSSYYKQEGEVKKACTLLEESVQLKKQLLGNTHNEYINSSVKLAQLYHVMEQHEKALQLLEQAKLVIKQTVGTNSDFYAQLLNNLAILHEAMGNTELASALYKEALQIHNN